MAPRDRGRWLPGSAAVLLAAAMACASAQAAILDVQAHRGCGLLAPGDTLTAFRCGIDLGVTTLEMDVQSTSDRVLVVHHDQVLDPRHCRPRDGRRLRSRVISELDAAEVADITCDGEAIPPLADVLALARDAARAVHVNVEIKMQDESRGIPVPELARLLVDLVTRQGMRDRTLVQSFRVDALEEVRRLAPDVPTSMLCRRREQFERDVAQSGARVLSPKHGELRREDLAFFHARGVAIIPWVVNDEDEMRRLIEWGIDGLITDQPELALRLRDEHYRSHAEE